MNRTLTFLGVAAGGGVATALLSMGVAAAVTNLMDQPNMFGLTPNGAPFDITSQTLTPTDNIVYGSQAFKFDSNDLSPYVAKFLADHVTMNGQPIEFSTANPLTADFTTNVIDKLWLFGGLQEQQIFIPAIEDTNITGGIIDIHNWYGWGYMYIDLMGAGSLGATDDAVGTWFVTPFGTFDVSWLEDGSVFGSPYLESELFNLDNFNPGAFMGTADSLGSAAAEALSLFSGS